MPRKLRSSRRTDSGHSAQSFRPVPPGKKIFQNPSRKTRGSYAAIRIKVGLGLTCALGRRLGNILFSLQIIRVWLPEKVGVTSGYPINLHSLYHTKKNAIFQ